MDLFEFVGRVFHTALDALPQAPDQQPGAAPEALPQAPAPAEVPSPAPHMNLDYDPLEPQIGGESLSRIYSNLICKYKGKRELPLSNTFL